MYLEAFLIWMKPYYLYILHSEILNRYYIGISTDPEQRLHFHNNGHKGWTLRGRPWKLVFQKRFESKQQARLWEQKIKNLKSRQIIEKIIQNQFNWNL